jgi:mRNA interferase MazF
MKGGMMYEQRDIVIIPFPYSDLTGMKQRPALIISNSRLNKTEDRICCLVTSNPESKENKIAIDSLEKNKLPFKSWVKPHRIFTVNEKVIRKKICTISDKTYKNIKDSIDRLIEIED